MTVQETLDERGKRYGDFTEHARIAQNIKAAFVDCRQWTELPDTHRQALETIADKIARILNGDPDYADNWHDIQGYARLVEERLNPIEVLVQTPGEIREIPVCCKFPNPSPDLSRCINCGTVYG